MSTTFSEARESGYERLSRIVEQRAGRYADEVELALNQGGLRDEEAELLDEFEQYVSNVLDEYPSRRRKSHQLIFNALYERKPETVPSERRRTLLVALMAAEVEAQGPLRLTMRQNKDLAEILEQLGTDCVAEKMMMHAAEAFERAAEIHLLTNDNLERDRFLYLRTKVLHRIERSWWRRIMQTVSAVTCGYGYRPYRLLGWVLVQLLVFWVMLLVVADGTWLHSLYLAAVNFINPAGTDELGGKVKTVLVVESYFGALSLNVFFALLVRRWFR
ncbi:hypothetical protein [Umezawaea tangerina]|uniref:Uncharacterized protein n=1 Tax=Umezawaea tangerina TaxID=84725 RepID=A0A2T0SWM5_9PSEU|nr:hypothetical protein [Umezawaea tangerina]PRY37818.1 hypothetical protein CLV43_10938 [Umezawaea tangerina]